MTTAVKICKIEGCDEPEVKRQTLCREHYNEYHRVWRAANRDKKRDYNIRYFEKNPGRTYLDTSGYVIYVGYDHPACAPGGITRYHRIVLWNKVDGQSVPCAECGELLRWDVPLSDPAYLAVDHINEEKADNRPQNLDPVHLACNTKRAHINAAKRKAAEEETAA